MINRHEECIGITLWKFGQKHVQLWYCPKDYTIEPHSHPEEDIELMYVLGMTTFFRQNPETQEVQEFSPTMKHIFKRFSVPAGWNHSFTVSNWPLVFINFSTFKKGFKPKSAAIDFKPITYA